MICAAQNAGAILTPHASTEARITPPLPPIILSQGHSVWPSAAAVQGSTASDGRFTLIWRGHFYLRGERAGTPSAKILLARLHRARLAQALDDACGVFALFVHDGARGAWQLASDNLGLYKLFWDEGTVATSFLELARRRGTRATDARIESLAAFLILGYVPGEATFVPAIRKLRGDEVLVLEPHQPPRLEPKAIAPFVAGPPEDQFERHFADFATSLQGRRVSVDITGGFDSRLVAVMLAQHGLPFELVVASGGESLDVDIAAQVAAALDRPFHHHVHEVASLDADLPIAFLIGDGQHEIRAMHKDLQNATARRGRGMEVMVQGGGGELFCDKHLYQHFPFYGRRRADLGWQYDLRFAPIRLPRALLGASGAEIAASVRADHIDRSRRLVGASAHETYIWTELLLRRVEFYGRTLTNYVNMGLDATAPFLDLRLGMLAARLSPWSGFQRRWHRTFTTRAAPAVAALPTTDGYSALRRGTIEPEVWLNFLTQGTRRLARKTAQRLLGRAMFHKRGTEGGYNAVGYAARLRARPEIARAVALLGEAGLLRPDTPLAEIPDHFVPRLLTLGLLAEWLDRPGMPATVATPKLARPAA